MNFIVDIFLLLIIVLCTWSGFRKGLIAGIAGILAVVIALLGGQLISEAYSSEIIPALEPFVDGYIDSADNRNDILNTLGYGNSDKSLNDILSSDSSLRYDYAYECMSKLGFYEDRAAELAAKAVKLSDDNRIDMTDAIIDVICSKATFLGVMTIAFLLILIFMVAVANLFNLSLRLPNLETFDELGGLVLGFIQGFIYCILICLFLSYFGLLIGRSTMGETTLGQFFLTFDFISKGFLG